MEPIDLTDKMNKKWLHPTGKPVKRPDLSHPNPKTSGNTDSTDTPESETPVDDSTKGGKKVIVTIDMGGNQVGDKTENNGYNPYRDKSGRFASGPTRYSNLNPDTFTKVIQREYGGQSDWGSSQTEAINEYVNGQAFGNNEINRYLTDPTNVSIDSDKGRVLVSNLDKSMTNKLNNDTTLYRGYGTNATPEELVGKTINYKGYNSTTFNQEKAVWFAVNNAQTELKRPVVLKINAKKGQKGILPILASGERSDLSLRSHEFEYILPRSTNLKVVNYRNRDTYEELEVEINER
jgi:hypothetical protein